MEYKDIELSFGQVQLLKKLKNQALIDPDDKFQKNCTVLCDLGLLSHDRTFKPTDNGKVSWSDRQDLYTITETGRMWLRYHKSVRAQKIREWITFVIAVAGFFLSLISIKMQL